jgi:hypothetical protein
MVVVDAGAVPTHQFVGIILARQARELLARQALLEAQDREAFKAQLD